MSLNVEDIRKIALESIEKYQEIIKKYQNRKWDAYAECNQNLMPNIDKLGRLHAPVDGYEYRDGSVYNKGEYLPDPEDEMRDFFGEQLNKSGKSNRLLILEDQKEIFESLNDKSIDQIKVEFSQNSWYNQNIDSRCTYAYLSGPSSTFLFNSILKGQEIFLENIKNDRSNVLKDVIENEESQIKGEIVAVRVVEDYFNSTPYKTAFKTECGIKIEEGNIIFGTLSKKMSEIVPPGEKFEDHLVGKKIEMTAKVYQNKSDPQKGIYKSPKKIKMFDSSGVEIKVKKEKSLKV